MTPRAASDRGQPSATTGRICANSGHLNRSSGLGARSALHLAGRPGIRHPDLRSLRGGSLAARGKASRWGPNPLGRCGTCSGRASVQAGEIHLTRVFTAGADRNLAQRRGRFRRRLGLTRHPDSAVLVESRAPRRFGTVSSVFRRALVAADAFAGLLVVGLASQVFGSEGPGTTALALVPLIVAINAMSASTAAMSWCSARARSTRRRRCSRRRR